jgi:hypothetical protein
MLIFHLDGILPKFESQVILTAGESYDGFLIADIGAFANDRELHFVEGTHEKLFVVFDQELFDVLKFAFTLGDRINVDTFH